MHVNLGRGVFPHAPRHFFDHHPALLACTAAFVSTGEVPMEVLQRV
jgi:hypothetical protein